MRIATVRLRRDLMPCASICPVRSLFLVTHVCFSFWAFAQVLWQLRRFLPKLGCCFVYVLLTCTQCAGTVELGGPWNRYPSKKKPSLCENRLADRPLVGLSSTTPQKN